MLNLFSSSFLKPDTKPFILKYKKVKTISSDPDATHIITEYHSNLSLEQYIHNIFVHDVLAKWDNIELLEYLQA
ncbi:hypothetical protein RclHR1_09550001 [Rhizophagus clarus]|uniref:Uncharacterized protein n=1 Tax=Rhizophagus clarus TaxID=94130 RepID=A0A2Z6SHW1_9GLOM|nr:hypothetical protein RclHR1_09550001 [Rhizophagus clarus]GES75424.1 hypothetical protein RCL_e28303_RclHR1_09550001 [Rhizophagus clarus]